MDSDRQRRAREVMQTIGMDDKWLAAVDPESPRWLVDLQRETIDAYRAGDLDWVLEHTHPEIEIVQPPEFPDGRTYRGMEGLIDAFLDWPNEWEDFRIEPTRISALSKSQVIVEAMHRGRSRKMGIEIEAQIVWLYGLQNGRTRRWDMFMSREAALSAARTS